MSGRLDWQSWRNTFGSKMRTILKASFSTFGDTARYDDEPWNNHYEGREQVRQFYEQLMAALPDLNIEIVRRHIAAETIILEVVIRGTQLGPWRGLPATGRRVEVPLCGVYTFSSDDRLAGERIYYDRAMVLRQLGDSMSRRLCSEESLSCLRIR
jgi:steroid delta-isomerase-like uncharacterized protein